jgi:hypothetical protein
MAWHLSFITQKMQVSKYFRLGFPDQWERYASSDMKQMNEDTQSPSKSSEYYIEKFLCSSYINSEEYNFKEIDFKPSKGPTGNTDGPPSRGNMKVVPVEETILPSDPTCHKNVS